MDFKKMDNFIDKLADYVLYVLVVIILALVIHKSIIGRYMVYEDYYNTHQDK